MGDGSAKYTRKLGLEPTSPPKAWACAASVLMVVDDGVVTHLAVEAPGKFEVSSAEAVLPQL